MKQGTKSNSQLEVWRVNAFTTKPFSGNPAGVVPAADGLSETLMQAIAAEVNDISETVFICRPETETADVRLRYFTSTTEVDLCGHATIAALFTLFWTGRFTGRDETKTIKAETKVGILDLSLTFEGDRLAWATMAQLTPQFGPAPEAGLAAEILGLPVEAIAADMQISCCSTGLWACFVPLIGPEALAAIRVDRDRIEQLWPENPDFIGVYPFAFIDEKTTQGRFFCPPRFGIVEDPVTGTACGALGGYLIDQQRLAADEVLFARQGVEMGRPGLVKVSQNPDGRMSVSGQAAPLIRGHLLV